MATMLPASSRPPRSLADTGENLISQVTTPDADAARKVAVVVIDGLGSAQLRAHSGHARFLHRRSWRSRSVDLAVDLASLFLPLLQVSLPHTAA